MAGLTPVGEDDEPGQYPRPVVFEMDDEALQAEFDQFADDFGLDHPDRETLSRKFGRLTSVFGNPDRARAVCRNIVDHYLAGAYRNGLKAQVIAFSRELAVTYTDTINELLAATRRPGCSPRSAGTSGSPPR